MTRLPRVVGCVVVGALVLAGCSSRTGGSSSGTTTSTAASGPVNSQVTGKATNVVASAAVTDPIKPPFTITVRDRGTGGAEIDGGQLNGKVTQINWGTGQPLPVSGTGPGLDLGPAALTIDPAHMTWSLDGAERTWAPGTYRVGSSVAIGNGGLATPVDNATFVAANNTTLQTRGDASIALAPQSLRFEGKDGTITITGALTYSDPSGDQRVKQVTFGPGPYDVTLTPTSGGYTVVARFQGTVHTTT